MGVKTIIKCDAVKVIDVPMFEGLAIQQIFEFAMNSPAIEAVLPPSKEINKLCRGYLSNVIYTVMGEPFQQWVTSQVNKRNKKVAIEGNNVISMDPDIARIFLQSTAISGKCRNQSYFSCSVEGQIEPPHEGHRPAPQVQGADLD
jgi:hypothetical protein